MNMPLDVHTGKIYRKSKVRQGADWYEVRWIGSVRCHINHMFRNVVDYGDKTVAWGYKGNGPKQLALRLLIMAALYGLRKPEEALNIEYLAHKIGMAHAQAFMEEVVSKWGDEWTLTIDETQDWLAKKGVKFP